MPELSHWIYPSLFVTAFVAGFVDSIAGGGGLITVPMLLSCGIPPHLALGTNKLQSCFGSSMATLNYARKGLVHPRELKLGIFWTALGAALGTIIIQILPADNLKAIIPFLLVAILVYFLLSPKLGTQVVQPKVTATFFYVVMGFVLGFYDGFLGPGTGSFWTVAYVFLLGVDLRSATAHTKVMNLTSNILSLIFFAFGQKVLWVLGLLMGLGQMCGAYLGSKLVIRRGTEFVRLFFLIVVAATILRLIYVTYWK